MPPVTTSPSPEFRLIVEPMCGLCNRLRVIDGAVSLAAEQNGRLEIVWFSDADLNCRFSDLFEPLPGNVHFRYFSLPTLPERWLKRLLHAYMKRTSGRYMVQFEAERLAAANHDFTELAGHGKVYLKTWSRFHPSTTPFANFRPVPHLQAIIDRTVAPLADAVGVHIRRSDFTAEINNITTDKFVDQMRRELAAAPETRFFLATDDPLEEKFMEDLFPGRIVTYRKRTRDRNRREGIEDAVVDLYSLGRCRKVLGSFKSSFSEAAVALCGRDSTYIT